MKGHQGVFSHFWRRFGGNPKVPILGNVSLITRLMSLLLVALAVIPLIAVMLGRLSSGGTPIALWVFRSESRAIYLLDTARLLSSRWVNAPPLPILSPPSLSENARILAFEVMLNSPDQGIYIQDSKGKVVYRTPVGIEERLPSVSPDGRQVAFWSRSSGRGWLAYVMDTSSQEVRQLTLRPGQFPSGSPIWSPGGSRLAMRFWRSGGDAGYFVADLSDGSLRSIRRYVDAGGDLSWSPDGRQLLFRAERDRNGEVYAFDLDQNSLLNLTHNPATDFQPRWSPDGKLIAFVSTRSGTGNIYLMRPDGSEPLRLYDQAGWSPSWSPNGRQIAFFSREGEQRSLLVIDSVCGAWVTGCIRQPRAVATLGELTTFAGWVTWE